MFKAWHKNFEFQAYIQDIQSVLDSLPRPRPVPGHYSIPHQEETYKMSRAYLRIDDLLQNSTPNLLLPEDELDDLVTISDQPTVDIGPSKLKSLLTRLSKSTNGHYQKNYTKDLQHSYHSFITSQPALK